MSWWRSQLGDLAGQVSTFTQDVLADSPEDAEGRPYLSARGQSASTRPAGALSHPCCATDTLGGPLAAGEEDVARRQVRQLQQFQQAQKQEWERLEAERDECATRADAAELQIAT